VAIASICALLVLCGAASKPQSQPLGIVTLSPAQQHAMRAAIDAQLASGDGRLCIAGPDGFPAMVESDDADAGLRSNVARLVAIGFVRVLDEQTIAFPNYDGNGMYLSMGNLLDNPHVGMLFIDFLSERPSRLRLNGIASIDERDELIDQYPRAQFIVRVRATEVFPNCPRYIHRMELVERSRFVPAADHTAPVPDWKRADWACDVLPAGDPARRA